MTEYVKNSWYMAAWEEEVADGALFARTLFDTPVLIFRKQDGGYAALEDRCPHRFAPLSRGKRDGDRIACGYHGLTFDVTGACVLNPFSDSIPANCQAPTFPIAAKDSILWIWRGDPAKADPAAIGDFSSMVSGAPQGRGHLQFEANYELLTDNLMDLSHIEFVHTGTFGGGGVIFKGTHQVKQDGDCIWSNWWMPNVPPPPWATFLPPEARVDHWLEMRWQAPASMQLEIGICPAGTDRRLTNFTPLISPHIITPATQTSSHYFYGFPVNPEEDDGDSFGKAFKQEDQPTVEAVQRNMARVDFWDRKPVMLAADAGAIQARRRLMKLRLEQADDVAAQ